MKNALYINWEKNVKHECICFGPVVEGPPV